MKSISEFFNMGGYAFFVWGSYLAAFITIGGELFFTWRRSQALKQARVVLSGSKINEKTS
jgi:heme exporter protein D